MVSIKTILTEIKHISNRILQLSVGQLVAAIIVAVQAKEAVLLTRILSRNTTMIVIGVSDPSAYLFSHA